MTRRSGSSIFSSPLNRQMIRYVITWPWPGKRKADAKEAIAQFLKIDAKSEEFSNAVKNLTFLYIKTGAIDEGISKVK